MRVLTFLLMTLSLTCADVPALKALLSQKGLTDVSQMMSVWIQSKMKSTAIPDVRGHTDIAVFTLDYAFTNMRVVQTSMSDPSVAFVMGRGVSVYIRDLSLVISGDWETEITLFDSSGTFDLRVYSISISTILQFGDAAGRLSVSTVSCGGGLYGVDTEFYGDTSVIFSLYHDTVNEMIKSEIYQKICPAVQEAVNELEATLQEISVDIPVDQYILLNIPLTSAPSVTQQSFELDFKGEFYSKTSPSEPPFSAGAFDVQCSENHMLSLAASEFSVNSAAYAYLRSGVLQININDNMIPKGSLIHLNTTQFSAFVPQLRTLYPNMKMEVLLYAGETPLFSFSSGQINLQVKTGAKFSAVKPDGSLAPLFRLDVDGNFSGNAQIQNAYLTGQLKMNNLTLTLGSSEIGDFKTDALEKISEMAMNKLVIPKLNVYLKKGFLVPKLKGFSLINSQLLIKNGFVVLFTDVRDSLTG